MPRPNLRENIELQMKSSGWLNYRNEVNYPRKGKLVIYNNNDYVVVSEDFECGGNFHILGLVEIKKYHWGFAKVIYVEEREGNVIVKSE